MSERKKITITQEEYDSLVKMKNKKVNELRSIIRAFEKTDKENRKLKLKLKKYEP